MCDTAGRVKNMINVLLQPFVNQSFRNVSHMSSVQLIDEGHLLPLTGGDADFRHEILLCFLGSARDNIDQLAAVKTQPDWKSATHRLKGLALSVGATMLADLAVEAEAGTRNPETVERIEGAFQLLARHIGSEREH
jgi:HPt (histidine-containing phosphotransfer) domain-containing protein